MATDAKTETLIDCPFVVSVDSREGMPYSFFGIQRDKSHGGGLYQVRRHFEQRKTADYAILGCDDVAIERKSLEDLFGTVGRGRERFVAELKRLSVVRHAHVVVESSLGDVLMHPPAGSRMQPKAVYRSILAWSFEFPVHWWFCDSRRFAEVHTFRLMEKFYHR